MLKPCNLASPSLLLDHSILSKNMTNSLRSSILAPRSVHFRSMFPVSRQTETKHSIVCARKSNRRGGISQGSKKLMLDLVSMIAVNLKILPQPLNLLIGEFARRDGNAVCLEYLNGFGGLAFESWRRKRKRTRKWSWFVFVSVCSLGLLYWKISELDLFLRLLSFCLVGISFVWLRRNKAFKEWILGLFLGIALASSRLGKEDLKFWVERLRNCYPAAQIVTGNRNRRRKGRNAW